MQTSPVKILRLRGFIENAAAPHNAPVCSMAAAAAVVGDRLSIPALPDRREGDAAGTPPAEAGAGP
jgi:hypothetical protein